MRIDRYGVPAKKEKPSSVRGGGTADRVARDILEMLARGHDLKPSLLMLPPEDFEALASEIRKRNG